jgi:outer membrane protein, heavy metal efflux system
VRLLALLLILIAGSVRAETLPAPLRAADVGALAKTRRSEIVAAKARARAAGYRPARVSSLDDPTIAVSLDHIPFSGMGVEGNISFELAFPLSRVRGNRRRAAEAGARRELAVVERVELDAELEAVQTFWMLAEARATARIATQQLGLADQLVAAAMARYSSNTGSQSDVLRAQTERARLDAEQRATAAAVLAGEARLRASLALDASTVIPELDVVVPDGDPPASDVVARGSQRRPELRVGQAEIEQAEADVRVMRSMYAPMAMVRTGPAYTMADGYGWMAMVGVSIPLWRGKYRAGIDEATAMVQMATADLDAMRRMAEGQARGARESVVAARARFRALRDDVVPRAEQAIAPTLAAYSAGQVPLVSVIEAAQALWSSQRSLVMARSELGIAGARLRRASSVEVIP